MELYRSNSSSYIYTKSPKLFSLCISASSRALISFMRDTEKDMKGIRKNKRKSETPSSSLKWATFTVELKRLGLLAGPMVTVSLAQYLVQAISMIMVGHLNELALSSTAVALSLACATGFSLLVSLYSYP